MVVFLTRENLSQQRMGREKEKCKEIYKLFLLFEINKFKILKVNIQKEIN